MGAQDGYDEWYARPEFWYGKDPSPMCGLVLQWVQPRPDFRPRLLDLGCGEGRNAVYFAAQGFRVTALDLSAPGLEKTRCYAEEMHVKVQTFQADLATYVPEEPFDVIFSVATLQFVPPEVRMERFEQYKHATAPGGVNCHSVFVEKPFIPRAPDADACRGASLWRSGELLGYYWDWEILYSVEDLFDCTSSGVPHRHAASRVLARAGRR